MKMNTLTISSTLITLLTLLPMKALFADHHGIGCLYDYNHHPKLFLQKTGLSKNSLDVAVRQTIDSTKEECIVAGTKDKVGCLSIPVNSFATCKINISKEKSVQWCYPLSIQFNQKTIQFVEKGKQLSCNEIRKFCFTDGNNIDPAKAKHPYCQQPSAKQAEEFRNAPLPKPSKKKSEGWSILKFFGF